MRGAIFDMDGLLIDSESIWQGQWRALAEERGLTLGGRFAGEICGTGGARTREIVSRYFQTDDPESLMRECTARVHRLEEDGVPLKPGVHTILKGLRGAGFRLAVASSSPMDMIRKNLRQDDVAGYFDEMVSGRDVKNGKPEPDIFLLAAQRLGLPPEECYVFEDSLIGVEAAWRAGCRAIMIPDLTPPDAAAKERCFGIFPDLAEAWERIRP